jgi:hypothetical protein
MARFAGKIGFASPTETAPGVFRNSVTELPYRGDIMRQAQSWVASNNASKDVSLGHRISVVADDYIRSNLTRMKYVIVEGTKWTISSAELQRPRVILSLGGIYNG